MVRAVGAAGCGDSYASRGGGGRGGPGQDCSGDVAHGIYGSRTTPCPPWDGGSGAGAGGLGWRVRSPNANPALWTGGVAAAGGGKGGPGAGWAEREVIRLEMEVEDLRRRSREAVVAVVARLRGGGGHGWQCA
jgi:hypothetical protein